MEYGKKKKNLSGLKFQRFFFFFSKKLEHESIENLSWGFKQFFLLNSISIHVAMISFLPGSPLIYVIKCWRHARSSLPKVLKHRVWNCCSGFQFLFSLTKPIDNLLVSLMFDVSIKLYARVRVYSSVAAVSFVLVNNYFTKPRQVLYNLFESMSASVKATLSSLHDWDLI